MAGDARVRIDPSSDVYKEFARLYKIVQEMHPGGADLWNGELYARTDDKWGGLDRQGTMSLNQALVLDHLTGGELSDDPLAATAAAERAQRATASIARPAPPLRAIAGAADRIA